MKTSNVVKKIISLILIAVSLLSLVGCDALRESCDHELVEPKTLPGIAPTCTDSGLTEGKQCRLCGEILIAQEEISPLGHIFVYEDDGSVENRTNKAHCTREGCGIEKTATDKERLIDEWRSASDIYYGDIEMKMKYFVDDFGLSNFRAADLKITDEDIFFNNRICDKVEYTSKPDLSHIDTESSYLFYGKELRAISGKEVLEIIDKNPDFEGCYKLESQRAIAPGFYIVWVYKSEGYFYFLFTIEVEDELMIRVIFSTDFSEDLNDENK